VIATCQPSDAGLPAEAARILLHPGTALWTAETNSVLREIAAGKRPLPALMCRNLVVRAARSLERRP
jgi:hypothetical protein